MSRCGERPQGVEIQGPPVGERSQSPLWGTARPGFSMRNNSLKENYRDQT